MTEIRYTNNKQHHWMDIDYHERTNQYYPNTDMTCEECHLFDIADYGYWLYA